MIDVRSGSEPVNVPERYSNKQSTHHPPLERDPPSMQRHQSFPESPHRDVQDVSQESLKILSQCPLSSKLSRSNSLPPHPSPTLKRYTSEPTSGRRSIFGNFWSKGCPSSPCTPIHEENVTPPSRRRSVSISEPELARSHSPRVELHMFSPPPSHKACTADHYLSLDQLPEDIGVVLPMLPSPLHRFYKYGPRTELGGQYPLTGAQPILRESSRQSIEIPYDESRSINGTPHLKRSPETQESFHLTCTQRVLHLSDKLSDLEASSVSSTTSSGSQHGSHKVRFDPRVTVTEYEDNTRRQWFSEAELEVFKYETIRIAQQYLLKHPEMVEAYQKPFFDEITGTMRKRALFSIPALKADESEGSLNDHALNRVDAEELVDAHVQQILVVDPNRFILDLFRRSLQSLFPRARITSTQSGEDALRIIQLAAKGSRLFDIIIVEEKLQRLYNVQSPLGLGNRSDNHVSCRLSTAETASTTHESLNDVSQKESFALTGSELCRRVKHIENRLYQSTSSDSIDPVDPLNWTCLLIGVSLDPERDAESFYTNGADLVWGKPPPNMNDSLRDELVSLIIKKRRKKSPST